MFHRIFGNKRKRQVFCALGIIGASLTLAPIASADNTVNVQSVDIYPSQLTILTEQGGTTTNYQCGIARQGNGLAARHEFDGQEITTVAPNGGGQIYAFYFRANFPEGLVDTGCQAYQGSDAQRRVRCQLDFASGAPARAVDCATNEDWSFAGCTTIPLLQQTGDVRAAVKDIGAKCDALRSLPEVAQQLNDPEATSVVEPETGPKGMKLQESNRNRAAVLLNATAH